MGILVCGVWDFTHSLLYSSCHLCLPDSLPTLFSFFCFKHLYIHLFSHMSIHPSVSPSTSLSLSIHPISVRPAPPPR